MQTTTGFALGSSITSSVWSAPRTARPRRLSWTHDLDVSGLLLIAVMELTHLVSAFQEVLIICSRQRYGSGVSRRSWLSRCCRRTKLRLKLAKAPSKLELLRCRNPESETHPLASGKLTPGIPRSCLRQPIPQPGRAQVSDKASAEQNRCLI